MFNFLIIFGATYLPWLLVIFLFVYLFKLVEKGESPRPLYWAGAAALLGSFTSYLIKHFYYQPRPFVANPDLVPLIKQVTDGSFPSAHAAAFAALGLALWFYSRRLGTWYLIGAILIGLARLAAHIHYPIDIVAGWLLGVLIACAIHYFRYNRRT